MQYGLARRPNSAAPSATRYCRRLRKRIQACRAKRPVEENILQEIEEDIEREQEEREAQEFEEELEASTSAVDAQEMREPQDRQQTVQAVSRPQVRTGPLASLPETVDPGLTHRDAICCILNNAQGSEHA